jgi:hypothetical protein
MLAEYEKSRLTISARARCCNWIKDISATLPRQCKLNKLILMWKNEKYVCIFERHWISISRVSEFGHQTYHV